ncbi:MAG: 3-isopropylmalate dehydratase large subunit [Clostridia bacterium]|nr:3-isopropylmalate dehydratase large subunit [Clostridia bacterium]
MATMFEKIIGSRSGKSTDQICFVQVDCVMTHDVGTAGVGPLVEAYGLERFSPNVEVVTILDHFVPASNLSHAKSHKIAREFVKKWQVPHFYDVGRGGICHQVMLEEGFARAGGLVAATDAHVTTYGGVGCLGLGVGVTDIAMILASGKMWIKRPHLIGIELTGKMQAGVAAKDLAISVLSAIPFEHLNYAVVEFFGEGVATLSMDDRFCLCNMLSEGGIKSALVACDERTEDYMKANARGQYTLVRPDSNQDYDEYHAISLEKVEPMLACPHHPTLGVSLSTIKERITINQAFVGSCTNGRMEDLRAAAAVLKGRKIHPDVRLVITPGSMKLYAQAMKEGLLDIFLAAEAMITNPSCGACIGASSLLAPGENCIATSNRNFRGRMGSVDANIWLASPVTVARAALAGYIPTPDEEV